MQFNRHPSREALIRADFFEPPICVFWRLPLQHPGAPSFFLLILHVPLHGPCRLCTGLDPSVEPQATGTGSQQLTLGFKIPRELVQPCSSYQLSRDNRRDFWTFWVPKQGCLRLHIHQSWGSLLPNQSKDLWTYQCSESGLACALHSTRELIALKQGDTKMTPGMRLWVSYQAWRPSSWLPAVLAPHLFPLFSGLLVPPKSSFPLSPSWQASEQPLLFVA